MHNTISVIFDYDDTIVPDSTTQLLKHYRIDSKNFWQNEWKALVTSGYDPTHAYLKLILDNIGEGKPLGRLTNKDLRKFGREVEKTQYPGLPELISDLKHRVRKHFFSIEFYIISGGLEEIIHGNKFIEKNFNAIYGCQLAGDTENSEIKYIKRAITFTEKTRYLFEISKGISPVTSTKNPMAVNTDIKKNDRKFLFDDMVYIGDGLTDIPCFSLIKNEQNDGVPLGIFHQGKALSEKLKIFNDVFKTNRTLGMYYPEYGTGKQLGETIRLAVDAWCARKLISKQP